MKQKVTDGDGETILAGSQEVISGKQKPRKRKKKDIETFVLLRNGFSHKEILAMTSDERKSLVDNIRHASGPSEPVSDLSVRKDEASNLWALWVGLAAAFIGVVVWLAAR